MHRFLLTGCFALAAIFFVAGCKQDEKAPAATTQNANQPKVDTIRQEPIPTEGARTFVITEGIVYWTGKPSIGDPHSGTIRVSGGSMLVNQGHILSGEASVDMTSIEVADLKDAGEKADLESHLKNKDFFEVNKYPKATFTFDEVLPSNMPAFNAVLTGSLTMKGKSNEINVPVKVTINGDNLTAESATFVINRTQWGVNFHSGILGTAKDKIIEDIVPVALKITAKAK